MEVIMVNSSLAFEHFLGESSAKWVSLNDIKSHLKNILHLKFIPKAFFFLSGIDVAQSLAAATVLNTHFFC